MELAWNRIKLSKCN